MVAISPMGEYYFQNHLTVVIGKYLQGIPLSDAQGAPNFLWYDHPAQLIYSSDNARRSHINASDTLKLLHDVCVVCTNRGVLCVFADFAGLQAFMLSFYAGLVATVKRVSGHPDANSL